MHGDFLVVGISNGDGRKIHWLSKEALFIPNYKIKNKSLFKKKKKGVSLLFFFIPHLGFVYYLGCFPY